MLRKYIIPAAIVGAVSYASHDVWKQFHESKANKHTFKGHYKIRRTVSKAGEGLLAGGSFVLTLNNWLKNRELGLLNMGKLIGKDLILKAPILLQYKLVPKFSSKRPSKYDDYGVEYLGI